MVILTGFLLSLGSAWMSLPFSMFCFLDGFVLSIQQWNDLEWRMYLTVLVLFLCSILPANRLQVENSLLSCYIAAKTCVSSADAYSPCTVSNSQLRTVHSSTGAIPLLACKSGPLLGFGGTVVKQYY